MPHAHTPTAVHLTSITLPDDGDPRTAASVNGPLQALSDGLAYLEGKLSAVATTLITASGLLTPPGNAIAGIFYGCGGGGGAGSGGSGVTSINCEGGGGGGGGGAPKGVWVVPIGAGDTFNVVIGAGGLGGISDIYPALGTNGDDGANTTVIRVADSAQVAFFAGGKGGGANHVAVPTSTWIIAPGGVVGGSITSVPWLDGDSYPIAKALFLAYMPPQSGGMGVSKGIQGVLPGLHAAGSPEGYVGGAYGAAGASSGSYKGGGGGAGGGAGPYGDGAPGGGGGNANNAGVGTAGGGGGSAADNSGGGGGGGGAGGAASGSLLYGGDGGWGGSGRVYIIWLKRGS